MPLSRYQIRNEYSLADPELYRAVEKDDPEALLEGVAMAGLVGVLRQLGDLAEFAAELFHDLHEEVMVTAARGHSLIIRVQQLEEEIPAVEKAFLSQTSHSSFLYNPGIVWHPKMRTEQNLVMSGNLPRFIMDSYEECRGPPRLFLLDKFDVAGAGACLKRYTDPSFFKLETSSIRTSGTDIQRERKIRKAKKKGSRWKNGETPEALSMSHAKLHQLFLEERIENGITDPARRVKLRKRLNGFPFDTKSGKSYMERFLKSPLPDHIEVHDIPVDSSPLLLLPNGCYEPVSEVTKINTMTPEKESETYRIDSPAEKLNETATGTGISDVLTSDSGLQAYNVRVPCFEARNVPSTPEAGNSEKVFPVDGGSSESAGDYKSDDIGSEVEQYMDALTTIESEIDTDTEHKAKSKLGYFDSRRKVSDFNVNDSQIQAISSESQSLGHSTLSDDGNSSSKKISIVSSSDTQSPSGPSDGEVSSIVFPCNHQLEVHDTTSIAQLKDPMSQAPEGTVSDNASTGIAEDPHLSSELDNLSSVSIDLDLSAYNESADSLETGKAPSGPEAVNTATADTAEVEGNLETDATVENAPTHTNQNEMDELDGKDLNLSPKASLQSNISGVALMPREGSSHEMSGKNTPIGEFGLIQQNSFVEIATDKSYGQNSDESQLDQQSVVSPFTEELHLDPVACDVDNNCSSTGEMTINATATTDTVRESVEYVVPKVVGDLRSKQLKQGTSDSEEEHFERTSVTMDADIMKREASCDLDLLETSCTSSSPSLVGENFAQKVISSESTYIVSEISSDLPLVRLKQDISGSEEEYFERFSDTGDAALRREAGCNSNHLEVDPMSIPSLLGDNILVHMVVPSVADGSSIDLKNSVEESVPAFEDEYIAPEDEKASPLDEHLKSSLADNVHHEKLDNISALSDVDDIARSDDDILYQYFASDNMHSDNSMSVQSSSKQDELEASFDELLTQTPQMLCSEETDASSEPMVESLSSQPLVSECLLQESSDDVNVPILSNSSLPSTSQATVTVEETPPLPPLPPVQWRITKLQHDFLPAQETLSVQYNAETFPNVFQSRDDQDTQLLNVVMEQSPVSEAQAAQVAAPVPDHGDSKEDEARSELSDASYDARRLPSRMEDVRDSEKSVIYATEAAIKANLEEEEEEERLKEGSSPLPQHVNVMPDDGTTSQQPQRAVSTMMGSLLWPSVEDYHKENGNVQHKKLPRPRNPLIDDVVALDKSKLRKVTDHVRPQVKKVDDRNSILEQIKAKSFNLKPAVVSRPSIQGPATNLKVAAILEKAKTIRQAFAGSDDEDDDNDSWSDS